MYDGPRPKFGECEADLDITEAWVKVRNMTAWFSGIHLEFGITPWNQKSFVRLNKGPDYGKTQWFSIRRANLKWVAEYKEAVEDLEYRRDKYEEKYCYANAKQRKFHMMNLFNCKEDEDDEEEDEEDSSSESNIR